MHEGALAEVTGCWQSLDLKDCCASGGPPPPGLLHPQFAHEERQYKQMDGWAGPEYTKKAYSFARPLGSWDEVETLGITRVLKQYDCEWFVREGRAISLPGS